MSRSRILSARDVDFSEVAVLPGHAEMSTMERCESVTRQGSLVPSRHS